MISSLRMLLSSFLNVKQLKIEWIVVSILKIELRINQKLVIEVHSQSEKKLYFITE